MEIINQYALEIFFGLVSAGALAFFRHLFKQNKELKDIKEEEKNRQYRKMIVDEIEPIIAEITRLNKEISNMEQKGQNTIKDLKRAEEDAHEVMYEDLEKTHAETLKAFELIINSYKFRLIQLCKTHLRDGYITESDFEQITEMYKLYHGLGGNGQAQEYYEKVIKLEIHPDQV